MKNRCLSLVLALVIVITAFSSCSSNESLTTESEKSLYEENYVTLLNTISDLAGEEGIEYRDTINGKVPSSIDYHVPYEGDEFRSKNLPCTLHFNIPVSSNCEPQNFISYSNSTSSLLNKYFPKNLFYKSSFNGGTFNKLSAYMSYNASSRTAYFVMRLSGLDSPYRDLIKAMYGPEFLVVSAECDAATLKNFDDIKLSKSGSSIYLNYSDSEIGEIVKQIFSDLLHDFNADIQEISGMTIKDIGFESYEF